MDSTGTVLTNAFNFLISILIAATISLGLFVYNAKLAFFLSIIVLVAYSVIMASVNKYLRFNGALASSSYHNIIRSLQEAYGGIRYIILEQLQNYFMGLFSKENKAFRFRHANNAIIIQTPKLLLESVAVFMICGVIVWFAIHGKDIKDMIPLMGFLVFACYRLLPAVQQIYSSIGSIVGLSASLDRVVNLLSSTDSSSLDKRKYKSLSLKNALKFKQVYFRYNDSNPDWTIKNMSFSIKAKSTVAFIGQTGSGKSTISDLILGLLAPQKGVISIDGHPLSKEDIINWQSSIAHVPQSIFLSDTTIAENVAFGVPANQIDMDQVIKVCKIAQIHDFIETLEQRYNERVGERGVRLSGGQAQRIGIARALYKNPDIIVFDEATSALDNKTEQEVVAAIDLAGKNLTVILIAHRLSTVKSADNIFLFGNGSMLAKGTYKQLLNNKNFKKLLHSKEIIG